MGDTDPRERFAAVSAAAKATPLPVRALLEAANDDHGIVRAVATYALLHAGDPSSCFSMVSGGGRFLWNSYGGGSARIGPLELLRIPFPTVLDLTVKIDELDIDPFEADAEFSFVPISPALFAVDLFCGKGAVDWIDLLAHFQEIALGCARVTHLAACEARIADLSRALTRRTAALVDVGRVLAADLRLPWDEVETGLQADASRAERTYAELRNVFSRSNQARTLRLARLADDQTIDFTALLEGIVPGGNAVWISFEELRSDPDPDTDSARPFTVINSAWRARTVEGGVLNGVEIKRVRGSGRLPLEMQMDASARVDEVINSDIAAILVRRLEGDGYPWRIDASMLIGRFVNSTFHGVTIEEYDEAFGSTR